MSYFIGSFNCLNFGGISSKDVCTFADIVVNEKFDIVALQEIKHPLALQSILNKLPSYWNGFADTECYDYAFIWNSRRFELANAYEAGKDRIYLPRIYKQYKIDRKSGQTDLVREPYFSRFFPVGGAAPYIEIRLINTHIRFSKGIIVSGDRFLASKDTKLEIKNEFDAKCGEMEGAAVAQVCKLCEIPFIVIRSISDELEGNAKVDFDEFLDVASRRCADIIYSIVDKF